MLIHLPPCFEAAAHAGDVFKSIVNEKSGRAETAVAMIAVDYDRLILIRTLQKILHVVIVQMNRARNMRLPIGTRIANIDKGNRSFIQLLLSIVNLHLGNLHASAPRYGSSSFKLETSCPHAIY